MTTPAQSQPDPAASRIQSDLARGRGLIDKAVPEVHAQFEPGSERPVDVPRTDAERLDWLQWMRDECEGGVLSLVFLPTGEALRTRIDAFMKAKPRTL